MAVNFVPSPAELDVLPEELADPIGDEAHTPVKGITHRYPDRLLLKVLHVCPVYCRFCFRREAVGPGNGLLNAEELQAALDYIREHSEVWEVITTIAEGQELMRQLRGRVSGLCQPTYVLDVPGGHGKVPIGPSYLSDGVVSDVWGKQHAYPP